MQDADALQNVTDNGKTNARIIFTTFGLTVLDEIRHPLLGVMHNVIGGSGTYGEMSQSKSFLPDASQPDGTSLAMIGARLAAGHAYSQSLAWQLRMGKDFPDELQQLITSWDVDLIPDVQIGMSTTRGLLEYADESFDEKTFRYTTPTLSLIPDQTLSPKLKCADAYHFLATGQMMVDNVNALVKLRAESNILQKPFIIWEPSPIACGQDQFDAIMLACRLVNVFSPNHLEVARMCGEEIDGNFSEQLIERMGERILKASDPQGILCVIIRAGNHGCYFVSRSQGEKGSWLPAYWDEHHQERVMDATGAGNSFLGGFAVGYQLTHSISDALCYGAVAASFVVEQMGLPKMNGSDATDHETWNGEKFGDRLSAYMGRVTLHRHHYLSREVQVSSTVS